MCGDLREGHGPASGQVGVIFSAVFQSTIVNRQYSILQGCTLDDTATLGYLEALAHNLGVEVRYESMEGDNPLSSGGMCRIRDKQVVIINQRAATADKVRTLVKALKCFDLTQIYLRPVLRDLLEDEVGG